jgi:hypothetical protein
MRLYTDAAQDGQQALRITFTEEPAPGDEVTGAAPTPVFIAAELAPALDGRVLDVDGSGDETRLVLHRT